MREFTIGKNDAGQRVDRFLRKAVPLLPGALAQKYIRLKRIKVNGARTERSYRLGEGDVLQLYLNDEFFDTPEAEGLYLSILKPELDIVYEDGQILVLNKPPGMSCHSGNDPGEITLVDRVKAHLYLTGSWRPREERSFVPALCNRLDRNTGGLVLAAKTAGALKTLNEKIRAREIDKYYLCAVHGAPRPAAGRIEGYMVKDRRQNKVTHLSGPSADAKAAVTEYQTLQTKGGLSLVECRLITGRTHQIRAQMAAAGCPLLGDRKYGGEGEGKLSGEAGQALWSYRLEFNFTTDAGELNYLKNRRFLVTEIEFLPKYFDYLISY